MKWYSMFFIWLLATIGFCVVALFLYDWLIADMNNMVWGEKFVGVVFSIVSVTILFDCAFGKRKKRS